MSPLYYVGFALWLGLNLLTCKKYEISRLRAGLYTLSFLWAVVGALIGGLVYSAVLKATDSPASPSIVAIFGGLVFTPVFIILTVTAEKAARRALNRGREGKGTAPLSEVSVRDTLDLLTPGCLIVLALSKLSCHFEGCCYGIPWTGPFAVVNTCSPVGVNGVPLFPVQLLAAALGLLLFVFMLCLPSLRWPAPFSRLLGVFLTLYSAGRFGLEFFRGDHLGR
ncbi:MAG: prolipoprotein diacylglyceryl transferase, partial [Clostridia bacterium]|nr:prolipoprotein diacylglyceryl transferase [Clostridia bacterium]